MPNASCTAWERPNAGSGLALSRFTSLSFELPVALLQAPNDASHWYVVEQNGAVRRFQGTDPLAATTFIDISARVASPRDGRNWEMGLLGMAFHPDYPNDPRVFLSYTTSRPSLVVSEFRRTAGDSATLDPGSERVLLTIDKPNAIEVHNGGGIAFGPDRFLYIAVGDGDTAGAVRYGTSQDLRVLLGKMLRIDVSDTSGAMRYRIPPSNPYANGGFCGTTGATQTAAQCAEIYAYGFRNPWRWSFDRLNGELWLGDVGAGRWEEVDLVTLGGNYGWRCREGAHDWRAACTLTGLTDPVTEYSHDEGRSITGGYVYRGPQNTSLSGRYLFADFVTGRISAWIPENAGATRAPTTLLESGLSISTFGEGMDGELYVADHAGPLYRLGFTGGTGATVPQLLSETGCVNVSDARQPAAGLIPYGVIAPFWSDGAEKDRWLALPDGQGLSIAADGDWDFPNGSVLMKSFRFGTQLIETRLFMRHPDGAWGGYSYEWNPEQTDARLVSGGATRQLDNAQQWIFPSEAQCLQCHTGAAGRTLGLETSQLNRAFTYVQTGRTANQLFTLNHIGILTPAIDDPASQPAIADPAEASADLTARARSYLHTNCSQCHRPGGSTPSDMDLRYSTALNATNACDATPRHGDVGLGADARLIAPGSAAHSVIANRMNRRDQHAMPPLGSTRVDAAGVALLTQWIDSLAGC